jgi:hypothetical protein
MKQLIKTFSVRVLMLLSLLTLLPSSSDAQIALERDYWVNTTDDYHMSDFYCAERFSYQELHLTFDNGIGIAICYHNAHYWDDSYENSHLGVFIQIIKGRKDENPGTLAEEWYIAPLRKGEWVKEKLIIDRDGTAHYYMDGQDMGSHRFNSLSSLEGIHSLIVESHPYGWWYTHYHYMDNFKLTTPTLVISDDFNDGVLNSAIWQKPENPDGVREEDGILKQEQLRTDENFGLRSHPIYLTGNSTSSNIEFADLTVKALCVANWDTNGDGELSYAEAAAVKDLGEVFKENNEITSFNELQYFTGLTSIGVQAFCFCGSLSTVTIPNSVTNIDESAFYYCTSISAIELPASVKSIGYVAFGGCTNARTIRVAEGNTVYDSRNNCNAIIRTSNNQLVLGCANTVIPDDVVSLGALAFCDCRDLRSISLPAGLRYIGGWALAGTPLTTVTIPEQVNFIDYMAFKSCNQLTSINLPASIESLDDYVFLDCPNLLSVQSNIKSPFPISDNVFDTWETTTLYVPAGTKDKYEETAGWSKFYNIVEMGITPIDNGEPIDIGNEIDENTNLDGNVVGDVYYCISSGDGSYDPEEGCIVVTKPTDDSAIDGKDIFGEDFKDGYTGFVFMVAPGKGTINVEAETTGNMVLKVKVGDNAPTQMEVNGKTKVSFSYDVSEPTFVFIYGSIGAAGAKGMRKAASTDALKIYGIEVTSETNGIEAIDNGQLTIDNSPVYNLNGQRVESSKHKAQSSRLPKGIYIQNGKKVLVK